MSHRKGSAKKTYKHDPRYDATLATFVPQTIKFILSQQEINAPFYKDFHSVVLFADISGFTGMTEAFLPWGSLGTEQLANNINGYLSLLVKNISGSGGDIFKFAGDALLCVWPPPLEHFYDEAAQMAELPNMLRRVIQCALDIQTDFGEMSTLSQEQQNLDKAEAAKFLLKVKLGIGVGGCGVLIVGGVMKRCEYLATGEAFAQAFLCENDCDRNNKDVIISGQCYDLVKTFFECDAVKKDGKLTGNHRVICAKKKIKKSKQVKEISLSESTSIKLRGYIPSAVVPHLRMPGMQWAGELRQVTIMFLSLPFSSKEVSNLHGPLVTRIHESIRLLQRVIYRYQGSLNKFLVDDKGSTVMAVFGLPPVAHDNDPERAVLAALDLRNELTAFNVKYKMGNFGLNPLAFGGGSSKIKPGSDAASGKSGNDLLGGLLGGSGGGNMFGGSGGAFGGGGGEKKTSDANVGNVKGMKLPGSQHYAAIGVTSGVVFLGLVGGGARREYSVLGDKVNLAARLMGLAKKSPDLYPEVLCDTSVYEKCRNLADRVRWDKLPEVLVKGKKEPVAIFAPRLTKKFQLKVHKFDKEDTLIRPSTSLIERCTQAINQCVHLRRGRVMFVEGESGLGKSSLLQSVAKQCRNQAWFLWGKGNCFDEAKLSIQYPVWKQILFGFNEKYPLTDEKNRRSFQKYIKHRRPDLEEWLFLLHDIMEVVDLGAIKNSTSKRKKDKKLEELLRGTPFCKNDVLFEKMNNEIIHEVIKLSKKNKNYLGVDWDAWSHQDQQTGRFVSDMDEKEKIAHQEKIAKLRAARCEDKATKRLKKKLDLTLTDIVMCLLEWAGSEQRKHSRKQSVIEVHGGGISTTNHKTGKTGSNEPSITGNDKNSKKIVCVLVDQLQWLRQGDWRMTRRLASHVRHGVIHNVCVFIASSPMDNLRYKPHYIHKEYLVQYKHLRDECISRENLIFPKKWGIRQTTHFIKQQFEDKYVGDVDKELVETTYIKCGGRPGFCNQFVELLRQLDSKIIKLQPMRGKNEQYKLFFADEIIYDENDKIQLKPLPIPATIQAITAAHLDVLDPESSLCLKTAATFCIAKGQKINAFFFEELQGAHPVSSFKANLGSKLRKLCENKFLEKKPIRNAESRIKAMKLAGVTLKERNNTSNNNSQVNSPNDDLNYIHDGKGRSSGMDDFRHRPSHRLNQSYGGAGTLAGRGGGREDMDMNGNGHAASRSQTQGLGVYKPENELGYTSDNDIKPSGMSGTGGNIGSGIMVASIVEHRKPKSGKKVKYPHLPLTKDLLYPPNTKNIPYKVGKLQKSKQKRMLYKKERVFIFKDDTLYWLKDKEATHPLGYIVFDRNIIRLKREDKLVVSVKTRLKTYYLRGDTEKEMDQWHALFSEVNHHQHSGPFTRSRDDMSVINTPTTVASQTRHSMVTPGTLMKSNDLNNGDMNLNTNGMNRHPASLANNRSNSVKFIKSPVAGSSIKTAQTMDVGTKNSVTFAVPATTAPLKPHLSGSRQRRTQSTFISKHRGGPPLVLTNKSEGNGSGNDTEGVVNGLKDTEDYDESDDSLDEEEEAKMNANTIANATSGGRNSNLKLELLKIDTTGATMIDNKYDDPGTDDLETKEGNINTAPTTATVTATETATGTVTGTVTGTTTTTTAKDSPAARAAAAVPIPIMQPPDNIDPNDPPTQLKQRTGDFAQMPSTMTSNDFGSSGTNLYVSEEKVQQISSAHTVGPGVGLAQTVGAGAARTGGLQAGQAQARPVTQSRSMFTQMNNMDDEVDPDYMEASEFVYSFYYGFLRDAVYEQMLHKQRQMIHKSSQEFLKKLLDGSDDRHPTKQWSDWLERHRIMANDTFELTSKNDNEKKEKDLGISSSKNAKHKKSKSKSKNKAKGGARFKMPRFIGLKR